MRCLSALYPCKTLLNRALPAIAEYINETWVWPGPLRQRNTSRKVFKCCKDMLCGVLGLVVLFLLLTNSATQPNPMADKWCSESPQSRPESAAGKQAGPIHLVHQPSAPYLQLDNYLAADIEHTAATCLPPSFAQSCLSWTHKQTLQQSQPSDVAITPTATALSGPGGIAQGPTSRLTATACTTAHTPAPSWALMLVLKLPVCSAVFQTAC